MTVDALAYFAATMTEDELLDNVVTRANECGWLVYHTHDARHSAAGFPDIVMIRRGVTIYAELKTAKGKLSEEQRAWLEGLRLASHRAAQALHHLVGTADFEVETPPPAEGADGCFPPMRTRLIQIYVWRPVDLLGKTIDEVLR